MKNEQLKSLEESFVELKKEIKVRANELEMEKKGEKEKVDTASSKKLNNSNSIPVQQNEKKKATSGYTVESTIIILLAIAVLIFKLTFK